MALKDVHSVPAQPGTLTVQTIEWPLKGPQSATEEKRLKRQSLRVRPSEYLDNAEPPPPLKEASAPSNAQQPPARMSLFNLFSRPKVERQRGYAERGLDTPAPPPSAPIKDLKKSSSTPNLLSHLSKRGVEETAPASPTPTAFTKASEKVPEKAPPKLTFEEPPKPALRESKTGTFEPPPLFQAYPQSTKDGILELSTLSVEAATHKSKGRKGDAVEEDTGADTKRSRATLRHGHHANAVLPRKMFVLITTGYLLQYAESGPANRLPERILRLGKDSAAFASDLLPGRHHVLQVSHAVDKNGALVPTSSSILSKFGIRSLASRRMISSCLLVMDSAAEMEAWMTAIRKAIESLGGQKIDPDPVRPSTRATAAMMDLKKTPSHRYQVKRNPSKVDRLDGASPTSVPSATPSECDQNNTDDETATIDGIEMEASKLDDDDKDATTRQRALSDAPSISSSAAVSVDQAQLNSLRKSESNSARESHTSQATTVASPGASQASSVAGSPPAEKVLKEASAVDEKESSMPHKSSFRPLSSYSNNWRRSGVPLAMQKSGTLPPAMNISPSKPKFSTIVESPDPSTSNSSSTASSPRKNLAVARSEPNLGAVAQAFAAIESSVSPPLPSLPPPAPPATASTSPSQASTVNTSRHSNVPSRRTSLQPLASNNAAAQAMATRTIDAPRNKRMSFSMPLKINPSGVHANAAPTHNARRDSRRSSQLYDPDAAGETPAIHTLAAKVDPAKRLSGVPARAPTPSEGPRSRLSFLAEQPLLLESSAFPNTGRTSPAPSPTHLATQIQAQANAGTLRRPTSLQVRSNPAPFLTSVRNSQTGPILDARAIPIRGMKPSRSASNVAALAASHSDTPSTRFSSRTPTLPEEREDDDNSDDKITPLPDALLRSTSPLPSRPSSRSSVRRGLKTRSSLPELDFGIPVVGLGPPAPPPNAPLPAPPPDARAGAASPNPHPNPAEKRMRSGTPSNLDAVNGLGIRVS